MLNAQKENREVFYWDSDVTPEQGGAKIASIIEIITNLYISYH